MDCWHETVTKRRNGCGWGQHGDHLPDRSGGRPCPPGESELQEAIDENQVGDPIQDDDRPGREVVDPLDPKPAVGGAIQAAAPVESFGGKLPVQFAGRRWGQRSVRSHDRVLIGVVVRPPAETTRPMARG